ncbi:MAG TPA: pyridoxamine 5'-phosphate oxidase family protein [Acidimicrobiia bacterium]
MNQLTKQQALDLLDREPVAHLGMIVDGEPYVCPMSFVVDGEHILFRTMAGKKLEGIKANPKVCIEVSSFDAESGDWQSVIVQGTARIVDDVSTGQKTIAQLFSKYDKVMGSPLSVGSGLMPLADPYVIEVPIERISGMSSGGGFHTRTKPGRL